MERKMQKADRQLPVQETKDLLANGHHGILAVNGDEGYPYAVPVNYVYKNDKIYIHSAQYGYKMEAVQKNNQVCFTAILSAEILPRKVTAAFESVIVTGRAVLVEAEAEKREVMETFVTRFCVGAEEIGMKFLAHALPKTAVLRIDVESLTGKAYRG